MDQIITAYKALWQNATNFSGRTSVSWYWLAFVANIVIIIVLAILAQISGIFWVLYGLYALAAIIPGIAIGIRRLHDTDKSGWFLLISLVPLVGGIILIVWFVQSGTQGPNQYGPAPLPDQAATA